jgi:hypothetical protein
MTSLRVGLWPLSCRWPRLGPAVRLMLASSAENR